MATKKRKAPKISAKAEERLADIVKFMQSNPDELWMSYMFQPWVKGVQSGKDSVTSAIKYLKSLGLVDTFKGRGADAYMASDAFVASHLCVVKKRKKNPPSTSKKRKAPKLSASTKKVIGEITEFMQLQPDTVWHTSLITGYRGSSVTTAAATRYLKKMGLIDEVDGKGSGLYRASDAFIVARIGMAKRNPRTVAKKRRKNPSSYGSTFSEYKAKQYHSAFKKAFIAAAASRPLPKFTGSHEQEDGNVDGYYAGLGGHGVPKAERWLMDFWEK